MKPISACLGGAMFVAATLVTSPVSSAQPAGNPAPRTGPASEASPMFRRYQAMAAIMKDMVEMMSRMHEEMTQADASPEARKHMAKDMKRMSEMMSRMSGAADRPTMGEPEMRRQFDEMRAEMARMKQSHDAGKPAGSK